MSYEINNSIKPKHQIKAIALPIKAETNKTQWLFVGMSTILIATLMTMSSVSKAQVYDNRDYQRNNNDYVTVYEHCDYRGRSRDISLGDYQNVRDLGLDNDSISSLRIPNGLEVQLFEDERFRGESAALDRDVTCLNRQWNDKASSLRVNYEQRKNGQYDSSNRNNNNRNRNSDGRYADRNSDYGREDRYQNRSPNDGNRGRNLTNDVERVEFGNSILTKGERNRWEMRNHNGRDQSYREVNRDLKSITLRNIRTRELLELDLYSSNARVISANGNQNNYRITRVSKEVQNSARAPRREPQVTPNPVSGSAFGVINGACFTYKAYAHGGQGGIKFDVKDIKQRFDDDAVTGRVCHSGTLTMEINKMDPKVDVFVEIQGRTYKFANGEKEDLLLNTWYRKMVKLKVTG